MTRSGRAAALSLLLALPLGACIPSPPAIPAPAEAPAEAPSLDPCDPAIADLPTTEAEPFAGWLSPACLPDQTAPSDDTLVRCECVHPVIHPPAKEQP